MVRSPTVEDLRIQVCELVNQALEPRQAEDGVAWEQLFSLGVLDSFPAGCAFFNDQFTLLKCNHTYADFLRIHTPFRAEQALGMCHFDYKPGSAQYLADWFQQVRDTRRAVTRYDLELWVLIDGVPHVSYWDAHLAPVLTRDGRLHGLVMCCVDVTQRNLLKTNLINTQAELARGLRHIAELETAIRVLLRLRDEDKRLIEERLLANIKHLLLPCIAKLKATRLDSEQTLCLDVIQSNLQELVSPLCRNLLSSAGGLTPTEIQVANLRREGKTSKEIAAFIGVSKGCVDFHGNNMRKKLGLANTKANLKTHLLSLA